MANTTARPIPTIHGKDEVRVRVLMPIASYGVAIRPIMRATRRGSKPQIIPVEAIMPRALAKAYGKLWVEIIDQTPAAEAPAEKQQKTPRDKQVRGSSTK